MRKRRIVRLVDLEGLACVAEHGSVTAAARELKISQSGLSRRIQQLERELDVALLDRSRLTAELTSEGVRVLEFAREVLASHGRLITDLHDQGPVEGSVHVIASTVPGEYVLPELVATFTRVHAEVTVRVFEADSATVATQVVEDGWDVGFTGYPPEHPDLIVLPVADDEIVLVVAGSHPFAGRETVAAEELSGQALIGREDGSGTQETVDRAFTGAGRQPMSALARLRLGSTQAVVAAAARGLGIGFVSTRALDGQAAGRIAAVRIRGIALNRPLYAIYVQDRARSPGASAFIDMVRARARKHAATQPGAGGPAKGG